MHISCCYWLQNCSINPSGVPLVSLTYINLSDAQGVRS
uniref:Uncharacterized protein n=1 Tax=Arundo donax TaxID=35708 RepID=A0A0A9BRA1_ARUDO